MMFNSCYSITKFDKIEVLLKKAVNLLFLYLLFFHCYSLKSHIWLNSGSRSHLSQYIKRSLDMANMFGAILLFIHWYILCQRFILIYAIICQTQVTTVQFVCWIDIHLNIKLHTTIQTIFILWHNYNTLKFKKVYKYKPMTYNVIIILLCWNVKL